MPATRPARNKPASRTRSHARRKRSDGTPRLQSEAERERRGVEISPALRELIRDEVRRALAEAEASHADE